MGAASDRWAPRRVLVILDLLSAVLVGAMVIPGMPVAVLLMLLFANGLLSPVYQGVRTAMLPDVLPPGPAYILGRSMMRLVAQSAQIVGDGAGGLLLTVVSPRGALALDAASFLGSAVLLRYGLARRPARRAAAGGASMTRDSLRGIRGVLAHRRVRRLLLLQLARARPARSPRRPSPHRTPATSVAPGPRGGLPAHGHPGRDRAGRPDRGPDAAGPGAAAAHRARRAAGVRAAGRVRGQPGPGRGPGPAGDLRPRFGVGRRAGRADDRRGAPGSCAAGSWGWPAPG